MREMHRTLLIGAFNSEQKLNARNNMSTFNTALSADSQSDQCNLNQRIPQPISSNSSASLVQSGQHIYLNPQRYSFPKSAKPKYLVTSVTWKDAT